MNELLKFYQEQEISPVHQDISDFRIHCMRREKLYRQLGIPAILIERSKILEVGPGGGYNAIVLKYWGCDLTMVEPNEVGCTEIKKLFSQLGLGKYNLLNIPIEEFDSEQKFDIVIAEGFLPVISNWQTIFKKLKSLVGRGGILVITCEDEIGRFVERVKRFIAHIVTKEIKDYDEKLERMIEIFSPQMETLTGRSRPIKDWIEDEILFEDYNRRTLTIKKAIELIGDEWDILGCSSPSFFVDYSWYKDVNSDYKNDFCRQYEKKSYNLILAGRGEIDAEENMVRQITGYIEKVQELDILYEKSEENNSDYIKQAVACLKRIAESVSDFDNELLIFLQDAIQILEADSCQIDFSKYPNFNKAFGRSAQYISFVKNSLCKG